MKLCNACGVPKHGNAFRKGEWTCRQCQSDRRGHHRRLHEYGLTFEEYSRLLDEQQGMCAVCGRDFDGAPVVDHDHKTRRVRGLLCHGCNTGLGLFRDDPKALAKAITYLQHGSEK